MSDPFALSEIFLNAATPLMPKESSAAIIINPQGEFLLQLRDDKEAIFFPHHWGCFGGAIDTGESRHDTLLRELTEELGVDFSTALITPATTITFLPRPDARPIARYFFAVQVENDILQRIRLGEGKDVKFFSAAQVQGLVNIMPYDKFAIWLYTNSGRL